MFTVWQLDFADAVPEWTPIFASESGAKAAYKLCQCVDNETRRVFYRMTYTPPRAGLAPFDATPLPVADLGGEN